MSAAASRPARRPRVCLIAPSLDILGGQAVQAARLFHRLRTVDTLDVAFLPVNPRLPGVLRRLQRVKYVRTLVTSAAYVSSLCVRLWHYDVLHVFSASYFSFVLAPLPAIVLGKLLKRRVLVNYRSGQAEDHLRRSRIARFALALADEIIVPSNYLVAIFRRFGLRARAIPNFSDDVRPLSEHRTVRRVFLSNRNHEPLYNVACVLRAFALIQEQEPSASLIVAGDGSERSSLERLAVELDLRDVVFVGQVDPEESSRLLGMADVYLNAPNIDNMPTSIIEAFAARVAVVTTDAGGIPYFVTHERNALVVPRDDAAAMAAMALRVVGDHGLAERLTTAGREDFETRYVWAAVRDDWCACYKRLAHPNNADKADVSGELEIAGAQAPTSAADSETAVC